MEKFNVVEMSSQMMLCIFSTNVVIVSVGTASGSDRMAVVQVA